MYHATWLVCLGLMLSSSSLFAASPQSRYIRKNSHATGVIVFVHGLMGDGTTTWTNPQTHAYWPDLISHDKLFDGFDIYVYEYPSPRVSNTYSPDEIAVDMRLHFDSDKILQHDHLVFLVHSLGGIVTRSYLTKYRKAAERVAFAYFFATPTTGSDSAGRAALISNNPQVGKLRRMTSTDYLADLQRQWFAADFKFPSYCAYEVQETYHLLIVDQSSASSLCSHLEPIDANHIDIVKPADSRSPSYLTFRAAFEQEVVGADARTQHPISGIRSETPRSTTASGPGPSTQSSQNGAAVGTINVQPGGAASVGQRGGITAGTYISNPSVNYIEPDETVRASISKRLAAIKGIYVAVEVESGNSQRVKIAEFIGSLLATQDIGGFAKGNTYSNRFPDAPVSLFYNEAERSSAMELISALNDYISPESITLVSGFSLGHMRLYINGTPTFKPNGSVVIQ